MQLMLGVGYKLKLNANGGHMERSKTEGNKVENFMTDNLVVISPDATLREAAQQMQKAECGVLPVGTDNEVQGMITDRDIVIRAVASGCDPESEKVADYMTNEVCCCNRGDSIEEATKEMIQNEVGRLVVKDERGKVCGILTLGSLLRKKSAAAASEMIGKPVQRKAS